MKARWKVGLFTLVALALLVSWTDAWITAQVQAPMLLDPLSQPKFVNPLPLPERIDATGGGSFDVSMEETQQDLGLVDPVTGEPLMTTVWGYDFQGAGVGPTYPGATIVAHRDVPIDVKWHNALPINPIEPHLLPVDTSIHWAFQPTGTPPTLSLATDGVPTVTHLHGGHTESASDGLPEAWFTPGFAHTGPSFVKQRYQYDNDQEAATLWYHDHTLGITRLNVYAGLAGFYLLRDANEDALVAANQLPTGPYEVELVIQDRMFKANGELFYPSAPPAPGAPTPSVLPEFFGDVILVNGMAWPVLDVEPRKYRFRMLNGSDSRFYDMRLAAPVPLPFQVIGSDTGLLDAPVTLDKVAIGPGERMDVVVDFSGLAGQTVVVRNVAKEPSPKGMPADPRTVGQIMAFRVSKPLDTSVYPLVTLPASLRPTPIPQLTQTGPTRQLVLFESTDAFGRLEPMLGTVADGVLDWDAPVTETPMLDDVEVWEIYNATGDTHPIHLHLVAFQILSRQKFQATVDPMSGALSNISLLGQPRPPPPEATGLKDTVQVLPGEVVRVIAAFDRPGRYVWHCHILSHEDHEMMRPYQVMTP